MPDLLLRRNAVVAAYPDEFLVILKMDDGFELTAGSVRKDVGVGMREFWAWSAPGANGQAKSRDEAMAAIKTGWKVADDDLARMRHQQEWTADKYALCDAGYRDLTKLIQCPCGASFKAGNDEDRKVHMTHIRNRAYGHV